MNMTIVGSMFFISFAVCAGFAAWLMSKDGFIGFIFLFWVVLFFGSVTMKNNKDSATCPKCGHCFERESKEDTHGN